LILAVSALDIDEMSGGLFRLGLGAGVRRLNESMIPPEQLLGYQRRIVEAFGPGRAAA
jgi:hypothetical protein